MTAPDIAISAARGGQTARPVAQIITAHRQTEGEEFPIRRPFPTTGLADVDPFLMLDEVGPVDWAPGTAKGAPDHPHRGFQTISYILSRENLHEDSSGGVQKLQSGDVQWMTTGAGIVHSEMPTEEFRERGGRIHSFPIWVNLPAADKWTTPGYQFAAADRIPVAISDDGLITAKVIAGTAFGVDGIVETRTPGVLQDWTVMSGGADELTIPADHSVSLYVFHGSVITGPDAKTIEDGELAILGDGDTVTISSNKNNPEPARLLVLGGRPIGEPVTRYGPFVINTKDEIVQAFHDYQSGRMGSSPGREWNQMLSGFAEFRH